MTLYHFTCAHGRRGLQLAGVLALYSQPLLGGVHATWATDMDQPDADALGLTAVLLQCDRTQYRYRVTDDGAFVWWPDWWPGRVDPSTVSMLTFPPKAPRRWWIATVPAPVELAP